MGAEPVPFLQRLAAQTVSLPADDFAPHVALRLMTVAVMLECLTPAGHARTPKEIAEATGMSAGQVQLTLDRLCSARMMHAGSPESYALTSYGRGAHESLIRLMRVLNA